MKVMLIVPSVDMKEKDNVWLKEAKIVPRHNLNGEMSGYQVHAKFQKRVNVPYDEESSRFQTKEIMGVKCHIFETGFRIMSIREFQLSFLVKELGDIMQHMKELPVKKDLKIPLKRWGKTIKKKGIRELKDLEEGMGFR